MSVEQLKENISNLSLINRFTLIYLIMESLKNDLESQFKLVETTENFQEEITIEKMRQYLHTERTSLMRSMGGLLTTNEPTPTDQTVEGMLQKRRLEKFLQ